MRTRAWKLIPRTLATYNLRGVVRDALREFDAALDEYTKAIDCNPKEGIYYANCAWIRSMKGEFADAQADTEKAVEFSPRDGWVYKQARRGEHGKRRFAGGTGRLHDCDRDRSQGGALLGGTRPLPDLVGGLRQGPRGPEEGRGGQSLPG